MSEIMPDLGLKLTDEDIRSVQGGLQCADDLLKLATSLEKVGAFMLAIANTFETEASAVMQKLSPEDVAAIKAAENEEDAPPIDMKISLPAVLAFAQGFKDNATELLL